MAKHGTACCVRWVILCVALFPSVGLAERIYGSIRVKEGSRDTPIREGVPIRVTQPPPPPEEKDGKGPPPTTKTDRHGFYNAEVAGRGECRLTIEYDGQKPFVDLDVYDTSVRHNLLLEREDGNYKLRRR